MRRPVVAEQDTLGGRSARAGGAGRGARGAPTPGGWAARRPGGGGGRGGGGADSGLARAARRAVGGRRERSRARIPGRVSGRPPTHLRSPADPGALARLRGLLEAARAVRAGGDLQPLLEAIA